MRFRGKWLKWPGPGFKAVPHSGGTDLDTQWLGKTAGDSVDTACGHPQRFSGPKAPFLRRDECWVSIVKFSSCFSLATIFWVSVRAATVFRVSIITHPKEVHHGVTVGVSVKEVGGWLANLGGQLRNGRDAGRKKLGRFRKNSRRKFGKRRTRALFM